jgi:hypothetical protein
MGELLVTFLLIGLALLWVLAWRYQRRFAVGTVVGAVIALLVAWLASNNDAAPERILLGIGIGLAATLVGMVLALLLVYRLLQPLRHAVAALDAYETQRALPRLVPHDLGQDEMSRLLDRTQTDLRFAKIQRFGRTRTDLGIDVFNLLNTNYVTDYNTTYVYNTDNSPRPSGWGTPISIYAPRFVRLNFTVNF